MSKRNVLLGLLAGVAAGAFLGILFAPEKGSKTRKKIVKKGEELTGEITDKFNDFIDTLSEKLDGGKDMVEIVKAKTKAVKEDLRSVTI
jgi:gas vesicle protein